MAGDLLFKFNPHSAPRLGMIVSRKFGNAVARNQFKRRCRNIFRKEFINENLDYSVIVQPRKHSIAYTDIQSAFVLLKNAVIDE